MAGAATRSLTTTPAAVPPPGDGGRAGGTTGRRRPTALLVGLAVLLLVVLGILAATALTGGEDEPATDPDTPAESQQPAPTETVTEQAPEESEPAPEPEPEPTTVTVDEDDYVGEDRKVAEDRLRSLGLKPKVEKVDNDGTQEEDTVASVSPTGEVEEGSEITLQVYDKAPPPEESASPPVDVETGGPGGSGRGGGE
jgi:serine/threonine-protein kinase